MAGVSPMQDQVCVFPPELRASMSLKQVSDWLKEYGGQIASVIVILGALLAGVRYVVKSEVADIRSDFSSVKSDISDLKTASSKTNSRIDDLLKDALERAFPNPSLTIKKAELEEDLKRANSLMQLASAEHISLNPLLIENYRGKIAAISSDPFVSGAMWPAAAELISYRSQNATSFNHDLLGSNLPNCVDSRPHPMEITKVSPVGAVLEIVSAYYENCRFTLDSPKEDAVLNSMIRGSYPTIIFKHCQIIYSGGPFTLISRIDLDNVPTATNGHGTGLVISYHGPTLQFTDCIFSFSAIPHTPENGKQMLRSFLVQSGPDFALPVATHS